MIKLLLRSFILSEVDMAYKVNQDICTNCGTCVSACPVEAILENDSKHYIDADKCIDCGACVSECPVDAISE